MGINLNTAGKYGGYKKTTKLNFFEGGMGKIIIFYLTIHKKGMSNPYSCQQDIT
jgi:hypothetical protein